MKPVNSRFQPNKSLLTILCFLLLFLGAISLLWSGKASSNQAISALVAKVYFDGEYRIADGP